ncbi:MAG: hypothetical protein IJ560_00190 [Alphaproteobacteria bacterium]|nr:hypothetical protein [Alphaproteobacteria bacterium]
MVCGIGAANAELPENVKFCIPREYSITYSCDKTCGGVAPQGMQIGYGQMFSTPTRADGCIGAISWRVNDTDTVITPGTTIPYSYTNDITLTAQTVPSLSLDDVIDSGYDPVALTWWITFRDIGTIRGVARYSDERGAGSHGSIYPGPNDEPNDAGSRQYGSAFWCKMTEPYETYWLLSCSGCTDNPAEHCTTHLFNYPYSWNCKIK